MGGRVVDCTGLENRRGFTPSVGSNPTPSATRLGKSRTYGENRHKATLLPIIVKTVLAPAGDATLRQSATALDAKTGTRLALCIIRATGFGTEGALCIKRAKRRGIRLAGCITRARDGTNRRCEAGKTPPATAKIAVLCGFAAVRRVVSKETSHPRALPAGGRR